MESKFHHIFICRLWNAATAVCCLILPSVPDRYFPTSFAFYYSQKCIKSIRIFKTQILLIFTSNQASWVSRKILRCCEVGYAAYCVGQLYVREASYRTISNTVLYAARRYIRIGRYRYWKSHFVHLPTNHTYTHTHTHTHTDRRTA